MLPLFAMMEGSAGSGKSVLAEALATRMSADHITEQSLFERTEFAEVGRAFRTRDFPGTDLMLAAYKRLVENGRSDRNRRRPTHARTRPVLVRDLPRARTHNTRRRDCPRPDDPMVRGWTRAASRLRERAHRRRGSIVMLGNASGSMTGQVMLTTIYLYVPDTDATYKRALEAGGTSVEEPNDAFCGDRRAAVSDPTGNKWLIATHVKDPTPEEMEAGARAAAQQPPNG